MNIISIDGIINLSLCFLMTRQQPRRTFRIGNQDIDILAADRTEDRRNLVPATSHANPPRYLCQTPQGNARHALIEIIEFFRPAIGIEIAQGNIAYSPLAEEFLHQGLVDIAFLQQRGVRRIEHADTHEDHIE